MSLLEFENGSGRLKNMAARGRGSFPDMAIKLHCKSHFFPIMKLGQNIGFIDIMDEFENGQDRWKNKAFIYGVGQFSIYV